jgi:hypothetical protein
VDAKQKAVLVDNGKNWLTAGLVVAGLLGAIYAYDQSSDLKVTHELALAAAVLLGATGHLALAHVQGRVAAIHGAMVLSMAVVGAVAGVVGVLLAAVSNDDASTLGLAVAGLGGAVAGAETLTRLASKSLATPAVSSIERTDDSLKLTGQGLGGIKHVIIGSTQVDAEVSGNTLTCTVPNDATDGATVQVGPDSQAATLALPRK